MSSASRSTIESKVSEGLRRLHKGKRDHLESAISSLQGTLEAHVRTTLSTHPAVPLAERQRATEYQTRWPC